MTKRTTYQTCPCCSQKQALSVTEVEGKTLRHCHYGCPQASVWQAFQGRVSPPLRQTTKTTPPSANEPETINNYALRLWTEAEPAKASVVEYYLRQRGLSGLIPASIRYLRSHPHKPSGQQFPVMLSAVTDCFGRVRAVHRTFLQVDGSVKAPVVPAKMTLGPIGGFACHLAPAAVKMTVSEGIETGLSVMQATGVSAWAALSAGGIGNLILPALPLASNVTVAADNDPVGLRSAQAAAYRWRQEGREVKIAIPPAGLDFNDVLLEAVR